MSIYLVLFGKPRYLGIASIPAIEGVNMQGSRVYITSPRGEELALVISPLCEKKAAALRMAKMYLDPTEGGRGQEAMAADVAYIAHATIEQIASAEALKLEEDSILHKALDILHKEHDLGIKLIDVEYLMDRKKLFFYFTSEQRVDFRAYVRDLARVYRTRIEMREVGIREEAKIISGLSPCGRPCCCSYWLHQFTPVNMKMVKEQNLALNPTKISGICGRLMCCIDFEYDNYRHMWAGIPGIGTRLKAGDAFYSVEGISLEKKAVRCRAPIGSDVLVPIDKFEEFKETIAAGKEWISPEEHEDAKSTRKSTLPYHRASLAERNKSQVSEEEAQLSKKAPKMMLKAKKVQKTEHKAPSQTDVTKISTLSQAQELAEISDIEDIGGERNIHRNRRRPNKRSFGSK